MALTDVCDLFGSVHEDGVNRAVGHVMRQRPSAFNYGTPTVAAQPKLWCKEVEVATDVINFSDPVMTVVPLLPIANTGYGLDYCIQITRARVDFHPGGAIALPAELEPPLPEQRFAVHSEVCCGVAKPPDGAIEALPPPRSENRGKAIEESLDRLPMDRLECFCLDLYAVGHVEAEEGGLAPDLDGLELVDVTPDRLETALEIYLGLLVELAVLPQLRVAIPKLVFDVLELATVSLVPTPESASVPDNPAIEDQRLKALIDIGVAP